MMLCLLLPRRRSLFASTTPSSLCCRRIFLSIRWCLPSSPFCQKRQFSVAVVSEFFLMCVDMNKSASGLLQQPQIGCSVLVSYETPGRATPLSRDISSICRGFVNVFIVSVFLGLNIQSQLSCRGIQSLKASVITRGYVSFWRVRDVHPLESLREVHALQPSDCQSCFTSLTLRA